MNLNMNDKIVNIISNENKQITEENKTKTEENDEIIKIALRILQEHKKAFEELAK